jgi:Zn finger protein HypA/HybF involved in hydrogenase expression
LQVCTSAACQPDTPSPFGVLDLKNNFQDIALMEPKLEAEKVMAESTTVHEEEKQVEFLEHEIECPRCHDSMALCSDFDNLYYVCEECDFCLYTIKKN